MKVYIASKFQNYAAVREARDRVVELGHEITFDWTTGEGFGPDGEPLSYNDESPYRVQVRSAEMDRSGVRRCDHFLLLAHEGLCGGLVELGMAIAYGKPITVVDPDRCFTIFYTLESVYSARSIDEALIGWADA